MDYNWPLFDGAHVLVRPKGMTVDQLQEGYYYFLREAYSLPGILRRFRGSTHHVSGLASHFMRNYLLSRYGMIKTAHAIRRKGSKPVWAPGAPAYEPRAADSERVVLRSDPTANVADPG
jgi:hypothetical protein